MSDVMTENDVQETAGKVRKQLTDAEKQAATLRRDATLLRKHGAATQAEELEAAAAQLAPVRSAQSKRDDPLVVLNQEEQKWLHNYFQTTKAGFAKIAAVVSAKKLEEIFQSQGN